jgi:hypothetical protein
MVWVEVQPVHDSDRVAGNDRHARIRRAELIRDEWDAETAEPQEGFRIIPVWLGS